MSENPEVLKIQV